MRPTLYRIDVSPDGHCDNDVDRVYLYDPSEGPHGPDATVDYASNPGATGTCALFPEGYDLSLTVAPDCLPSCGSLRVVSLTSGKLCSRIRTSFSMGHPGLSLTLHELPSSQMLPVLTTGAGQPLAGTQAPTLRHWSAPVQVTTLPPPRVPLD
jgi:hypothetical protein